MRQLVQELECNCQVTYELGDRGQVSNGNVSLHGLVDNGGVREF